MSDSTELELVTQSAPRTVDLRNQTTDSWTDVLFDVVNLARGIAPTEFVPKGIRCECKASPCTCGGVEKTTASVLYSRELGLPPMTGLGVTHVIEGKPGISAEAMRSLILQAGHELAFPKRTATECVMRGRRKGSAEWTETSFTLAEAAAIKFRTKEGWKPLTTKANWQNFPADMLLARATTRLARMLFPDVIHGMRSAEELADMVETVTVQVVEEAPPPPARVSRVRKAPAPASEQPQDDPEPSAPVSVPVPPPVAPEPDSGPEDSTPVDVPAPPPPAPEEDDAPDLVKEELTALETKVFESLTDRPVSTRAVAFIQMQFDRLGVTVRDEKLFWIGQIIGREIGSSKDLTADEGKKVANQLEQLRDRDALEALGAGS